MPDPDEIIHVTPGTIAVVEVMRGVPGPQGAQGDQGLQGEQGVVTDFGIAFSVDPRSAASSGSVQAANRAHYVRSIRPMQPVLGVTHLVIAVVNASGNISVGVYSNTGTGRSARPDARKATTGSIVCPSIGVQAVALTAAVDIDPGDWFALSADNTTATFGRGASLITNQDGLTHFQNTAHPIPLGVGTLSTGSMPFYVGTA